MTTPSKDKSQWNYWLIAALLLLPLMITGESLWLDEGDTAMYALQPDFCAWWQHLNQDHGADCQMPLSMLVAWIGGKSVGTQEWQLRAVNIVWGALALWGLFHAGKRLHMPWLPLFMAIQPYFWFYMNEARPYALEIAGGSWLFAGFVEFIESKGAGELWTWIFSIAAFVLCLATMLAPLPIVAALVALGVVTYAERWHVSRKAILILSGMAVMCAPIGIFYVSTLVRGAKGAELWHVDLKFFGYVVYELTGMSGLGPATEHLREIAKSPDRLSMIFHNPGEFILPAVGLLLLFAIFILGLRQRFSKNGSIAAIGMGIVLGITSLVFITCGLCLHKAFWARHFAPIFPFYIGLLAIAVSRLHASHNFLVRLLLGALMALLVFSSFNLRLSPEHRKENYRAAAQYARSALKENKTVWWAAGELVGRYYHLDISTSDPEPGKVLYPRDSQIENFPQPDIIILSKPDIFDADGKIQRFIHNRQYQLVQTYVSFTIWGKLPANTVP
jgi:hypothetical protein